MASQQPPKFDTKFQRKIPSNSTIYSSFVYGTPDERENRQVLSTATIILRIKEAIDNETRPIDVTKPDVKPLYEAFKTDVLNNAYNSKFTLEREDAS